LRRDCPWVEWIEERGRRLARQDGAMQAMAVAVRESNERAVLIDERVNIERPFLQKPVR
jgi:hypothetical protein